MTWRVVPSAGITAAENPWYDAQGFTKTRNNPRFPRLSPYIVLGPRAFFLVFNNHIGIRLGVENPLPNDGDPLLIEQYLGGLVDGGG